MPRLQAIEDHEDVLRAWLAALTLVERRASPVTAPITPEGQRRLAEWRAQAPFATHPALWQERLRREGLTEELLAQLLSEDLDALATRIEPPAWARALDEALLVHAGGDTPDEAVARAIAREEDPYARAVLRLVAPLAKRELALLREATARARACGAPLACDDTEIAVMCLAHLPEAIGVALMRTVAFEVNVARARGLLTETTPGARFEEFITALSEGEALRLFYARSPVLARHLFVAIGCILEACRAFVEDLARDWPAVRAAFDLDGAGAITRLSFGAGDTHRRGRSVVRVTFGSGRELMYKPRSGAVDERYAAFADWLEARGGDLVTRVPKIVAKHDRFWSDVVAQTACQDREAVRRFYRRQGATLAIFYVLGAGDMHAENVIAAGEEPILVDLEGLFSARLPLARDLEDTNPAARVALHSVLGMLFLPVRVGGTTEHPGYDVSALGNRPGQRESQASPVMREVATDVMFLDHERQEVETMTSRPSLLGEELDPTDFLGAIRDGFTEMWSVLEEDRAALVRELERFGDVTVRVIPRPTRLYAKVLTTSFHPKFLRDGMERDRLFDRLWLAARTEPSLGRLIAAERADLMQGDVPFFTTHPRTRDVIDARGAVIPDVLDEAPLTSALRRAAEMDRRARDQQLWLIDASFATVPAGEGRRHWRSSSTSRPPVDVSRDELLARAARIATRIEDLAIHDPDRTRVGWLGVTLHREVEWIVQPTQVDLYSGTTGIALFLAFAGAVTSTPRWTELARTAVSTMLPRLRVTLTSEPPLPVGIIGDVAGPIFALAHLGALLGDATLLDASEEIAKELVPRHLARATDMDVAEGASGAVLALLALHAARPSSALLEIAARAGDRIVDGAIEVGSGLAWANSLPSTRPLTGFAHGVSGIAHALHRLARATDNAGFDKIAARALDYERSVFDPNEDNWPDFRRDAGGGAFAMQWCHGAPGIGLARLETTRRDELEAAARATRARGLGLCHCVCHGDFGNLELLFALRERSAADAQCWKDALGRACASLDEHGPLSGVPLGIETPGLFVGLAGIGWQLLRFAEPTRVPSLVMLDPPQ